MKLITKSATAIVVVILVLAAALLLAHFYGAQLPAFGSIADAFVPGIVSSQSYKRVVMHPQRGTDPYSAYTILGWRKSPVARDIAAQHLHSDDAYLWMNAAHYLGCIGDPVAVPYLIKALRHTASRADEERRELLVALTGQDFGTDFVEWQRWWISRHPDFTIDWKRDLGRNPRITEPDGATP